MRDCVDSQWRHVAYMLREIRRAVIPGVGLRETLRNWSTIARGLRDPPRARKSQHVWLAEHIDDIDC